MHTCVQPVSCRAMPENEIPPAMRVDFYFIFIAIATDLWYNEKNGERRASDYGNL